jgi:glycosyltransferase involved in cell wall biosynthesis
MNILQVNTADLGGGAEGSARALHAAYRERGHGSWLAVGRKSSADPDVFEVPRLPARSRSGRLLQRLAARFERLASPGRPWPAGLARRFEILAEPARRAAWLSGNEDFHFPGTARLLAVCPRPPDIVHCHNLHGGYFDLRELPALSRRLPLILNLRDTWLLTGHCGYFIDCERWRRGCGHCPDLCRYPGIRRDATAANWQRKAALYAQSRLYVTAPSEWLLGCARQSMLQAVAYKVIPNGIDLSVFRPGDPRAARGRFGLDPDRPVVLFAAASRHNVYKDPETMNGAIRALAASSPAAAPTVFLCVGAAVPAMGLRGLDVRCIPFVVDREAMADCYRAADVFVHTARAEAFGKTVTEAMACGTPVVASAVGGIPEQLTHGSEGFLAPPGDALAMAAHMGALLADTALRERCSRAAADRARRYDVRTQCDHFLDWYAAISEQVRAQTVREDTPPAP